MCNGETCSEKERLKEMQTDLKWVVKILEDSKGISVYKRMTWVNFAAIFAVAIFVIRSYISKGGI